MFLHYVTCHAHCNLLPRLAVTGDSVSFFLNISRIDEMSPDYDITLLATLFHPSESLWNTTFDPMDIASTSQSPNRTETVLNLAPLRYVMESAVVNGFMITIDRSQLQLELQGVVGAEAYTIGYIQLHGSVEFQSVPTNGRLYEEPAIFPKVFIRNVEFTFDLVSTTLEMTEGNLVALNEVAIWEANISRVTGLPANLSLLIELNNAILNITDVHIVRTG